MSTMSGARWGEAVRRCLWQIKACRRGEEIRSIAMRSKRAYATIFLRGKQGTAL